MDRLINTIRPYAWGSVTALPELTGEPPTGQPQAELWMGAHPSAPSLVERQTGRVPLNDVIAADPTGELGAVAVQEFGPGLPFLFKILAADSPLSLQVHPDLEQARQGYADEERREVPLSAPERNYKDSNHKPELLCALGPFEGLCGFRPAARSADLLAALEVDGLKPYVDMLRAQPESAALREVFTAVLGTDPAEIADTVAQAVSAAERLGESDRPYAAAYRACAAAAHHYPGDPGFLAALLLNHVRLQPGEALYLGAGVPHAYLSGLGVELMANSDNVLRCGFTPKHVDVAELLRIVRFESRDTGVLRPEAGLRGAEVYSTPAREFGLSRYVLAPGSGEVPLDPGAPRVLLCTAGEVLLRPADGDTVALGPGQSVYVGAGAEVRLEGEGTLFLASTGL